MNDSDLYDYEWDEWLVDEAIKSSGEIYGEIVKNEVVELDNGTREVTTTYKDGHVGFSIFGKKAWKALMEIANEP